MIALAHFATALLTWMFLIGSTGSLLVIIISFFEDLGEIVGKE